MAKIDAMKMVRGIRNAHYRATKGKSFKDVMKFYRDRARAFRAQMTHGKALTSP